MEAEQHRYELRSGSRSRSQTPSIQSRSMAELAGDLAEHPYDLRSRSRERSHTPSEIGGTRKSMNKFSSASISQSMQLDQSAESPIEAKEENNVGSRIRQTQGVKADDATVLSRKVERRSERQKLKKQQQRQQPPPPPSSSSPHLVQMSQLPPVAGKLSNETERIHDTNRSSSSPRRILTSDYSSEEGERENQSSSRPGSAYEIYKQAGDWWNVFPKTDYTYSAASQCRYEIAPGILAMPNMSRRPIHPNGGAVSPASSAASTYGDQDTGSSGIWEQSRERNAHNSMTMSGPADSSCTNFSKEVLLLEQGCTHGKLYRSHQEISYSDDTPTGRAGPRRRAKPQSVQEKFVLASAAVESDAEFEDATIGPKAAAAAVLPKRFGQRFVALLTRLALWFGTLFQLRRHPGTTGRIWSGVYRKMDRHTQYLYLLVVKVLLLDTWLLSRASYVRVHLQERVTKPAWLLIMTPLLLLIGSWCLPFILLPQNAPLSEPLPRVARRISLPSDPDRLTESPDNFSPFFREAEGARAQLFHSELEELRSRMDDLQRGSLQQMEERLSNVTRLVESVLNGDQLRFWSSYEHKLAELEEKLMNYNAGNLQDTASIRTAFESLKEECLQLKSCCQSRCAESFEKGFHNAIAEEKFTGPISSSLSHSLTTEDVLQILETVVASSSDAEGANNAKKPIGGRIFSYLTDIRVRKIVKDMLKVYDADKTGRVDYALESAGGLVISTRCTQRYDLKQMAIKILSFTLYYENNNPRTVIQGNPVQPGTCWAFQGFPGYLLIKLRSFVHVSGFTLEHAPKSILPNEEMRSAPRSFNVWGFTDEVDPEPVLFGNYEFKDSDESLQYFPVQNTAITEAYEYVELRVHSNHGQLEYTCLYRFRVHGKPA